MVHIELLARTAPVSHIPRLLIMGVRILGALRAAISRRTRGHYPAGSLNAATLRDIGACRQHQDYAPSADLVSGSDRRLHRIVELTNGTLPR